MRSVEQIDHEIAAIRATLAKLYGERQHAAAVMARQGHYCPHCGAPLDTPTEAA